MADEEQVRCPYDANHVMLKKSYQKHITKCAKNFPTANKKQCPFNAGHMVEELEYEYHLATCENSGDFRKYVQTMEPDLPLSVIDVTEMSNIQLPSHIENWNENQRPIKKYDPLKESEDKLVIRPIIGGFKKSERKRYKQQEIQRFITLSNNAPISKPRQTKKDKGSDNEDKKLRLPQHPPKALLSDKTNICNETVTNNIKTKTSDNDSSESVDSVNYSNEERKPVLSPNDISEWFSTVSLESNSTQIEKQLIDVKQPLNKRLDDPINNQNKTNLNNATNSHADSADEINARMAFLSKLEEEIKKEKVKLHEQLNDIKQNNQSTNPFRTKNVGMPRCSVGRGSLLLKNETCKIPEIVKKSELNQMKQGMTYAQSLDQTKTKEDKKNQPNISQHTDVFYGYGESDDDIDDDIVKHLH